MNQRDELVAHHPWLRRLARRFARSATAADDLVQDTCVTALRNAPPDAQLQPWLRAVMRKLAWGQLRGERRRIRREEAFSFTAPALTLPDALLEHSLGHGVDRDRLSAALARVPEPFHSTLVQRFFQGRSCAEIARRENVPAGTVRWRQARGLELLRARLIPRRQPVMWALPFASASERFAARIWRTLAKYNSAKVLWLGLVGAAALFYALRGAAPHASPPASLAGVLVPDAAGIAPASSDRTTTFVQPGGGAPGALVRALALVAAPHPGFRPLHVLAGTRQRLRDHGFASEATLDTRGDDCQWDPASGWRCLPTLSTPASPALCATIHRQILTGEALAFASPAARRFVAAALLANRALAAGLGCPLAPTDARTVTGTGGNTACVTRSGPDGDVCTVCPGERPVCAPAECQSRMRPDGVICTTCGDARGDAHTDCSDDPPGGCDSQLTESGLVCTRCGSEPAECLAAACDVIGGCLRCVDPKGRVGTDCSIDYSTYEITVGGTGDADDFSSCGYLWGIPSFWSITCHFPGTTSCEVQEGGLGPGWNCLRCDYPDGSGMSMCSMDQLPDPLDKRPQDLPAPGSCIDERSPDGLVVCTTCTRDDLGAVRSCRYAGVRGCSEDSWQDADSLCRSCQASDGSHVELCTSP